MNGSHTNEPFAHEYIGITFMGLVILIFAFIAHEICGYRRKDKSDGKDI